MLVVSRKINCKLNSELVNCKNVKRKLLGMVCKQVRAKVGYIQFNEGQYRKQ